jgi:glutathionyl-hydroquinone reductase
MYVMKGRPMRRPLPFRRLEADPAGTTYRRSAFRTRRTGMGLLVDGVWQDRWYDTEKSGGRFIRTEAQFRNWITPDGSAGPSGRGGFKAEPGRYHLYVSLACPWASRALIFRALKGLEAGPVSPLCLACLPLGVAGADFPRAEGPRRLHLRLHRELVHGSGRMDL